MKPKHRITTHRAVHVALALLLGAAFEASAAPGAARQDLPFAGDAAQMTTAIMRGNDQAVRGGGKFFMVNRTLTEEASLSLSRWEVAGFAVSDSVFAENHASESFRSIRGFLASIRHNVWSSVPGLIPLSMTWIAASAALFYRRRPHH